MNTPTPDYGENAGDEFQRHMNEQTAEEIARLIDQMKQMGASVSPDDPSPIAQVLSMVGKIASGETKDGEAQSLAEQLAPQFQAMLQPEATYQGLEEEFNELQQQYAARMELLRSRYARLAEEFDQVHRDQLDILRRMREEGKYSWRAKLDARVLHMQSMRDFLDATHTLQ